MNDISNTALVTLKCHIQDANGKDSILNDQSSLKTFEYLNLHLNAHEKALLNKRVKNNLVRHTALRAKKFDDYAIQFLKKNPESIIVNIGCGLDHRFERIDNGKCIFIDLDFPDIMDVKSRLFPITKRYRQVAKSVFDFSWMDELPHKPVILLAEGVFMYCHEKDVKSLFHEIHQRFPGAEMVFEVFSAKWLKGWKKSMINFKMRKQLKFGEDADFKFGINDSQDIESWSENYKFIEDWSYFDVVKPNIKDYFRKIQWTVYYKIN